MKRWVRWSLWMLLGTGIVAVIAWRLSANKKSAAAEIEKETAAISFSVSASYVRDTTFTNQSSFQGTVEAAGIVTLFSETDGKLLRFPVQRGQRVQQGQMLGSVDRSIKISSSRINEVNYEKARSEYNRLSELLAENNASRVEVENARVQMETYAAQLAISKKQVAQTVITAPVTGVVVEKKANEGDYVQPGGELAVIAELKTVIARIYVPELSIVNVKKGGAVSLTVDAFPGQRFFGVVKAILPVANEVKAFPVDVLVQNPSLQLMAGMSVSAVFPATRSQTALIIPRTALTGDLTRPAVFVIDANKTPRRVKIETGQDFGTAIEVKKGLAKGDVVITSGQANIEPGKILKSYTLNP